MESLKLTEQEQRAYAELFGMCDVENTGKVTGIKAFDLFLTSGLTPDVLHKITELCGAKRLGHFGRSQFYIALKFITLAQHNLPVSYESLGSVGPDFPLPSFACLYNADGRLAMDPAYNQHLNDQNYAQRDRSGQMGVGGLPPPPKHPRGSLQLHRIPGYDSQSMQSSTHESPADTLSPQFSPNGSPPISPGQHQGDTQSIKLSGPPSGQYAYQEQYDGQHQKSWAQFDEDNQGLLGGGAQQEQRQWANFSDHKADTSSISSEAESVDDVWTITDEQHEYYVNQFMTMQPNMTGVIPGHVAKEFFEKSKLPVPELSRIWQLSDVDRDGGLSLEEFCTAMHLVVLRRNDIELPEHLPPALMPYVPPCSTEEPFAADLPQGSTLRRATPPSPTPPSPSPPPPAPQPPPASSIQPAQQPPPQQQGGWAVGSFPASQASPTSSSMSSPGTKPEPVKFAFKPVMSDPDSKIVHPVPMRVSPDGQALPIDGMDRSRAFSDGAVMGHGYEALTETPAGSGGEAVVSPTTKGPRTPAADLVDLGAADHHHPGPPLPMPLQGRPRPTPKKAQTIPGPSGEVQPQPPHSVVRKPLLRPPPGGGQLPPEGVDRPSSLAVSGEMAPPPPPRAKTGHSRSSSLDNQLIDFSDQQSAAAAAAAAGGGQLKPPPAVPPRPSPKDATTAGGYTQGVANVGAGDVRELGACAISSSEKDTPAMGSSLNLLDSDEEMRDETDHTADHIEGKDVTRDRKELKVVVRKHRERNNMLLRLNNELNQELQEVMEQRIALEIQLEHLRPFST